MDGNICHIVGTSDNNDNDDVRCRHPAGLLFWVQMLKSNIPMSLLSDPLNMSMVQRNFVSHTAMGEMGALLLAAADARTANATLERRRQRRTMTGSHHWVVARDRAWSQKMSLRRSSRRRTMTMMTAGIGWCWGCLSNSSSL
jgi:hypothetical protein